MIVVLAVRFRKWIALFLLGIFYSQFILAAEKLRSYDPGFLPGPYPHITPGRIIPGRVTPGRPVASPIRNISPRPLPPTVTPLLSSVEPVAAARAIRSKNKVASSIGGPNQPEMQSFTPVNGNNMVDLFSGDFSYNIPLLDVGGYPVNIAYHSGRSMDEDASWVGLGWNVNPGSITRDMRGLPDDFSGGTDTLKKVSTIKPNITWGVTAGADLEVLGLPIPVSVGGSLGIYHSTYNGWALENNYNVSLNSGDKANGPLSGGLSISNSSKDGLTLNPSLSMQFQVQNAFNIGNAGFGVQLQAPYNSRTGLKDIQLGLSGHIQRKAANGIKYPNIGLPNGTISFSWPTYTPSISIPLTNYNFSFTVKGGAEAFGLHPNLSLAGYYAKEYVAASDSSLSLPAYGYLNFQNRGGNWNALTDFNREKEIPYRESPAVPHIAVPAYTYDVFTITGEGTGGMFRAYRGDIGYIADHLSATKSTSGALSVDLGIGNASHAGVDLNGNYSVTQSGPWLAENPLGNMIDFQGANGLHEAAYFRNPGEKTINTTDFYNAIGGDNTVAATLSQPNNSGPSILTSNYLTRYNGAQKLGMDTLTTSNTIKTSRDKRGQVISYLTAEEAAVSGLDKYINRYAVNQFGHSCENDAPPQDYGVGTGLLGYYYDNPELKGQPKHVITDTTVYFDFHGGSPFWYNRNGFVRETDRNFPASNWTVRWMGRLKAPASGSYTLGFFMDDGFRFWMDDTLLIDDWHDHHNQWDTVQVNLVAGKMYNVRAEYMQAGGDSYIEWGWRRPDFPFHRFTAGGGNMDTVAKKYLYPPVFTDTVPVNPILTKEDRVNTFRKSNHISEIDVLNPDGRKYVYGIPVYNLVQKESSFSVDKMEGNARTGLTTYTPDENSVRNTSGRNGYYSREEIPAYAHSFLLTGILSPDYVDVTGDGISDDDIGDAVRFDYSKTSGVANPFGWRAPYVKDSATYNEGFRSYDRDDKAHYIYGQKELWYLHTIESKTMIATFKLCPRHDLLEIDERGTKTETGKAMYLKEINLYSKADFMAHDTNAIPIKTVHFEYTYELCRGVNLPTNDSGKLTLKRIWFTYNKNNKGKQNPYVFNYHSNNPRFQVNMADKWGSYKDPAQNPGASSSNPIPNSDYPYSLQDSTLAANNAAAWTLDSIQLPSGGRIKVNYESDDYAYVQNRRSTLMCRVVGIATDTTGHYTNRLYNSPGNDGLYVYARVPYHVTANADLYARYLDGIGKLYFRMYIAMPKDDFGSGSEYIPCYADLDSTTRHWYGRLNDSTLWIRIKGVNSTGNDVGPYNPLAQTAINFLRLNLPSKAYPGSEVSDDINIADGIRIVLSMVTNITGMLSGFVNTARGNGWACTFDTTSRSFVRLNAPTLKKIGGGLRVKSVLIYDNWNAMTKKEKPDHPQKETVYGQLYDYTTTQSVNGVMTKISSGVAEWEPSVGGEENPFHLPIEYVDRVSVLAPAAMQYTEEPLGEAFYPAPSIGYRKVRVRSIHTATTRSANGYSETTFYTGYDFPTTWDYSRLDNDTKKRYKPILNNLLRINAKNYLTLSQGFKVELNDMNGKVQSESTYSETDSVNPISSTQNFYRVDNQMVQVKHLSNTVATIDPQGNINAGATIGKDAELMTDMRDQTSNSTGANIDVNEDMFVAGVWPVIIPTLLGLYQHETNQFRSVAMTKVIQRYGILDSVVHIDKGSRVSSKNLLYDAETGDPVLVRTQNEFNDSLFQFSYPAHWVYAGAGPAYQNIDAQFSHLTINHGMISGSSSPDLGCLFPGDEVLVSSLLTITPSCTKPLVESFPDFYKLWVVDSSLGSGTPALRLVDQYGTPFSGSDVALKIIRSGHRNLGGSVGSLTSLANPMVPDGSGGYHLLLDSTRRVVTAGANEMQQIWRVSDKRRSNILTSCIYTTQDSALAVAENCTCLKPFFDYLISHNELYSTWGFPRLTVGAIAARAGIDLNSCPLLQNNANGFYTLLNPNANSSIYMAMLGNGVTVSIRSLSGEPMNLATMTQSSCDAQGTVHFKTPGLTIPPPDTVTVNIYPTSAVNLLSSIGSACPTAADSLEWVDSSSDKLLVENSLSIDGVERNSVSILNLGRLDYLLPYSGVVSAKLILHADQRGHLPPMYPNANSTHASDTVGFSLSAPAGWFPYQPLDTMLYQAYYTPWFGGIRDSTAFQDISLNMTDFVNGYLNSQYVSSTFVLTQGSGGMHATTFDSAAIAKHQVPPYLTSGYGNYYSTYYSPRYADTSKRPVLQVKYLNYHYVDTMGAVLEYNSSLSCSTVYGRSCYSSITDTLVNPYQFGILGDYRPQRSYVYYGRRKESDPQQLVDIRKAGTISSFAPFWVLNGGKWTPSYDTTRWVWNSQTTLFNRKGFELENKDPLGRYNSGLYGYGLTLPTAVTQNSRYQESAFEGFEDYGYQPSTCDTACAEARPFDFSSYLSDISDSMAHSGLYSLRIAKGQSVSLVGLNITSTPDPDNPQLSDSLGVGSCGTGNRFDGMKAASGSVLPPFKPFAGKRMLVGAWVKEQDSCTCQTYSNNHLLLSFTLAGGTTTTVSLLPSGNMIEGWQRYEAVVDIPASATAMTLTLQASATSTTYFDDIRIHPFNAEMKSYVYNPVNLRLMAELDENNYATFYEYDDDGTLIRVKKETERGIQTIKETRSALLKDQ